MSNQSLKDQLAAALAKVTELENANKTAQAELEKAKAAAKSGKKGVYTRIHSIVDAVASGLAFTEKDAILKKADALAVEHGVKSHPVDTAHAYARVKQCLDAGMALPKAEVKAEEPPKGDDKPATDEQPKTGTDDAK